jgi:GNAT superfamily N-acetyltransferase
MLTNGAYEIAPGKLVSIVTALEMTARPPTRPEVDGALWRLERLVNPDPELYLGLYRAVGATWLWTSRLVLSEAVLRRLLVSPHLEVYRLTSNSGDHGILELDFRQDGDCELASFGLEESLVGQGAGRWLMNRAMERVWAQPMRRFWLHTCTLDHPAALAFYKRSGFTPFRRQIEIEDDPRLTGLLPQSAAPHVPLAEIPGAIA